MTKPHRATPEEWEAIELASVPREIAPGVTMHHAITVVAAGLVDLRSRVDALEQLHQAVVDLNEQFSLEPLVARIDALEAAQGRAIRQPMQQPVSVDLDENDRRFRAALAAIDNATPEQLHRAAPADHSRGATEMAPVATDQELWEAWYVDEPILKTLRTVYDMGRQQDARRTDSAMAAMARELERLQTRLAELEAKPTTKAATEPAVAPAWIIADRYQLGDSIRRAWLTHGQDSWCVIADCVIAELGAEPTANAATEPAPPQPGGIVRDGVSWSEREGDIQFIQPAGPAQYQAAQAAFAVGLVERVGRAIHTAVDVGDGKEARAAICEVVAWLRETGNHGSARDLELEVTQ